MHRKSDYLAPIPALFADATPGRGLVRQAITGLSPNLKRFEVTFVKVGEKVVAEVPTAQVEHLGLRVGSTWSEQLGKTCVHAKAVFDARDVVIGFLEIKPHARGEMVLKLKGKGIPEPVTNQALDELAKLGLFKEHEAAESIVRAEIGKGSSIKLIRDKLREIAVTGAVADELLTKALGKDQSESKRGKEIAKDLSKKLANNLSHVSKWRRLLAALDRRGFDEETSTSAARAALGKMPEDEAAARPAPSSGPSKRPKARPAARTLARSR